MKKTAIILFIGLLIAFSGCIKKTNEKKQIKGSNNIQINIKQLLGMWKIQEGIKGGQIEFIKNDNDILYFIYNNSRQSDSGKVILKNDNLILDNGTIKEKFNHINISPEKISMINEKGQRVLFVKEKKEDVENEEILKNVLNNLLGRMEPLAGIESGDLKKATFTWNIDEKESKKIHGFYVKCNISDTLVNNEKLNETLKDMIDYLTGLDYKSNVYNVSENQEGLSNGTYIIKLIINKNYIDLYFGELK